MPAAPATVGAYLASLAETHAPTTIRRRLSALGKMHRFNDLPWNPAHRAIQGPLQGVLRTHGRPVPRGMEFLYSLNRLNVVTSRAKCICILGASPSVFEVQCRTPRQMQLANAFARYLELASPLMPLSSVRTMRPAEHTTQ